MKVRAFITTTTATTIKQCVLLGVSMCGLQNGPKQVKFSNMEVTVIFLNNFVDTIFEIHFISPVLFWKQKVEI